MHVAGEAATAPISDETPTYRGAAILCLLLPSVLLLLWLLWHMASGLDVSDEGFYLNSIADPHLYDATITQFGFFYHYLYWPIAERVAMLRTVNLVVTLVLGTAFGMVVFSRDERRGEGRGLIAAASFTLSFTTMMALSNWLASPNYNTLNLQGLLVAATALLIIGRKPGVPPTYAIVLLAVGGWITFLAKPSSAALLGPVALLYLLAVQQIRLRTLTLALVLSLALLLLASVAIDGSPVTFLQRLQRAAVLPAVLDPRYSMGNLFRFSWPSMSNGQWTLLVASAATLAFCILVSTRPVGALYCALPLCILTGVLPLLALYMQDMLPPYWKWTYTQQILTIPAGLGLAILGHAVQRRARLPSRSALADAGMLWLLPYVFAFGTNNEYWYLAPHAGIFWVGSACILLEATQSEKPIPFQIAPAVLGSLTISSIVVLIGMMHPYRQTQSILLNDTPVAIRGGRAVLNLSPDFAAYFQELQSGASAAGFRVGDPMIDLTGHYPGALYALGAKAIGMPWLVGGYPGSDLVVRAALARVPCTTLAKAWLFAEPEGPMALSPTVVGEFGQRYEAVLQITSLVGDITVPLTQQLLKPVHDAVAFEQACEKAER